jgi:hypothetical protein
MRERLATSDFMLLYLNKSARIIMKTHHYKKLKNFFKKLLRDVRDMCYTIGVFGKPEVVSWPEIESRNPKPDLAACMGLCVRAHLLPHASGFNHANGSSKP